jgi:hypothetical protein
MSTIPPPVPGTLVLYDDVQPPLSAGSYRAVATTTVTVGGADQQLRAERHLEVEAPRFFLPPSEIAAVYPPRNGHGGFHETLPHIVLRRRTLPWERALDASGRIPAPSRPPGEQAPRGASPWMALLLLDEGEGQVLERQPLEEVVPPDVFARLGSPAGVRCDALEIDRLLLRALLPSLDEIKLLAHARQVETDGRALDAGDGWFAVVMANRLPRVGARHRVCLVSLEERSDLVVANPPAVAGTGTFDDLVADANVLQAAPEPRRGIRAVDVRPAILDGLQVFIPPPPATAARLVLLTSWTFEGGDATFAELMSRLDVGLFGLVPPGAGQPALADTGHLPIALEDRSGVPQTVWYRSPLGPHELARDTVGPYHAADQARRVSPETGAEDITYAAAFEVGRLLCAADGRAAAELLRWRRTGHREAARHRSLARAAATLALESALVPHLATAPAPVLAVAALARSARAAVPRADSAGTRDVRAPGLDPTAVADAWALPSRSEAEVILSSRPITTRAVAPVVGASSSGVAAATAAGTPTEGTTPARRLIEARDARLASSGADSRATDRDPSAPPTRRSQPRRGPTTPRRPRRNQ